MKTSYIQLFILLVLFTSCEKVIDVDLATGEPRLVVEASINWYAETDGNEQQIKLSTTTSYYSNEIPPVIGATVYITNSTNQVVYFVEDDTPGTYKCSDFIPIVGEDYTLTIVYEGQTYTATEKLLNTPTVSRIEQKNDAGFLGEDIEVKFFYDDLENETNQYLLKIDDPYKVIPEYGVLEDRFFQNNEMFGLYISEELKASDTLKFTLNGISLNHFNYMNILLAQTGTSSAGPFSTPTSTIRGNIINQTNFNNFALGYFRLSKTEVEEYIIE